MAEQDKRFEIRNVFEIQEVTPNGLKPFYRNTVEYFDAPYDVVLGSEGVMKEAQDKLYEMGFEHAEKKGLPTPPGHGRGRGHGQDK